MKKTYIKPMLEVENFELNASIASNCATVVSMGPEAPGHAPCKDYYDNVDEPNEPDFSKFSLRYNVDFWEKETCLCYYSASGTFFTS